MQKKIILSLLLSLLFFCGKQDAATGNINTITIISSKEDKAYSEHIIEHFFENKNKIINTPQTESTVKRNILFLSLTYPADSSIDVLSNRILKENNIKSNFTMITDLFATPQKAAVLKVTDAVELETQLKTYSSWLYSEYDQNIYSSYYNYLKENNNNLEVESEILNKFSLSIFIQEDYKIISNSDDFLWIGRGYPYRWLVFYRIPGLKREDNVYDIFKDLCENYNLGIQSVDDKNYHKKMNIGINTNTKTVASKDVFRGVYSSSDSGGPFTLYVLDNIYNDELILVASIINNPGKKKVPHLLQADALIRNIKFIGDLNE